MGRVIGSAAVLAGVLAAAAGIAHADEPTPAPAPAPAADSTDDELADMVMAVIEQGQMPGPELPLP
jgi:hypothetical protein